MHPDLHVVPSCMIARILRMKLHAAHEALAVSRRPMWLEAPAQPREQANRCEKQHAREQVRHATSLALWQWVLRWWLSVSCCWRSRCGSGASHALIIQCSARLKSLGRRSSRKPTRQHAKRCSARQELRWCREIRSTRDAQSLSRTCCSRASTTIAARRWRRASTVHRSGKRRLPRFRDDRRCASDARRRRAHLAHRPATRPEEVLSRVTWRIP